MPQTVNVTTGPDGLPLSLNEAKQHLRVTVDDDNRYIESLIAAAVVWIENFTARALITRTLGFSILSFPADDKPIICPRVPLRKVESIKYYDTAGVLQTLATTEYEVFAGEGGAGEIRLKPDKSWPSVQDRRDAVTVSAIVGYATKIDATTATDLLSTSGHPYAIGDKVRFYVSGDQTAQLPKLVKANFDYTVATTGFTTSAFTIGLDLTDVGSGDLYAGEVPRPLLSAMLLLISHWYQHRESVVVGITNQPLAQAADALVWPYRARIFA